MQIKCRVMRKNYFPHAFDEFVFFMQSASRGALILCACLALLQAKRIS